MKRLGHPILAILLVASLVLVGGVFSAFAVEHTVHHAHHKAAAHSNAICSWMCAAGQVLQAFDLGSYGPLLSLTVIEIWGPSTPDSLPVQAPASRGPPVLTHLQ